MLRYFIILLSYCSFNLLALEYYEFKDDIRTFYYDSSGMVEHVKLSVTLVFDDEKFDKEDTLNLINHHEPLITAIIIENIHQFSEENFKTPQGKQKMIEIIKKNINNEIYFYTNQQKLISDILILTILK